MKTLLKLFDATLLDASECHLHCCEFRHSLDVISFFGHKMKLIFHKSGRLYDQSFFAQAARELRYEHKQPFLRKIVKPYACVMVCLFEPSLNSQSHETINV
jgi:hypothetical protein